VGSFVTRPLRIGLVVIALLVIAACAYVLRAERYHLTTAYVNGNSRVPAEQVFTASGLAGKHVLAVRRRIAERRVEELPDVREAIVRVKPPNHVFITIVETEPKILWISTAGRMAIDENGRAVRPPADESGLLHVHDQAGLVSALGQELPSDVFAAALAFGERFKDLEYRGDLGFVASGEAGVEIWLGAEPRLAPRQLAQLDAILNHVAGRSGPVELVDVRFPSRPYYRQHKGAN
jgi:hypothetical protein